MKRGLFQKRFWRPLAEPTQAVSLGFIASGAQIFGLTVSQNIALGTIAAGSQVFPLTITQNVNLGAIAPGAQVFALSVSVVGGAQTLSLGFIASEAEVYALAVSAGDALNLAQTVVGRLGWRFVVSDALRVRIDAGGMLEVRVR